MDNNKKILHVLQKSMKYVYKTNRKGKTVYPDRKDQLPWNMSGRTLNPKSKSPVY